MEATDDQYLRSSLIRLNRILDFKRKTKITGLLFRVIKVEQVEEDRFRRDQKESTRDPLRFS
ncbi:hypothetical protein OUZ56_000155 [Daphnia magna]|uniref:Uncharacterized protein n=1 Tax=Daphnia magna TaxID=35525 RepID=A0ABQ9ZZ33_9CRUS|nr:hypothetical protein OUZ56_000155 [Daphnia magna]